MWQYLEDCGWTRTISGAWLQPGADPENGPRYDTEDAVDVQRERDQRRLAFVLGYGTVAEMMAAIGAKEKGK